ncbi:MAG: hypothetical protein C0404_11230 [Verrucomicrobia bacterium]|nr:hypothetical protein [Verrucomicrobiota bacterium]
MANPFKTAVIGSVVSCLISAAGTPAMAGTAAPPPKEGTPSQSTAELGAQTTLKGLDYLATQQKASGAWGDESYPAMTAFGLWAFSQSTHSNKTAICARAAKFLEKHFRPDGGIYAPAGFFGFSGGLSTYNTAVCMTSLFFYDQKTYATNILAARKFLAANQLLGDSGEAGGFGYDKPGKGWAGRPDLSNTAWSLQAMRVTQGLEDQRPKAEQVDIDWQAATKFIDKLQNKDESDTNNVGSIGYDRSSSRGSTSTDKKGAVTLRGYGSMTYAGLESMIYAQVKRDDPRVVSAMKWASRNWSVDENPGMGTKGLFYYYNIMSKALSLSSGDTIPVDAGTPIPWKQQLVTKLAQIQRKDGSWINKDNTFWEGNPVLVTSYAVLALQYIQPTNAPAIKDAPRPGN